MYSRKSTETSRSSSRTIILPYCLIIFVTPLIIEFASPQFSVDLINSIFLNLDSFSIKLFITLRTSATSFSDSEDFAPSEKIYKSVQSAPLAEFTDASNFFVCSALL